MSENARNVLDTTVFAFIFALAISQYEYEEEVLCTANGYAL